MSGWALAWRLNSGDGGYRRSSICMVSIAWPSDRLSLISLCKLKPTSGRLPFAAGPGVGFSDFGRAEKGKGAARHRWFEVSDHRRVGGRPSRGAAGSLRHGVGE